jgi:transcriptional regulator with XRE-family HTH domain
MGNPTISRNTRTRAEWQDPSLPKVGAYSEYASGMDLKSLGALLKSLRKEAGKSMKEVAAAAGVTYQQIDHIEAGRRQVPMDRLEAIASAIGCKMVLDVVPVDSESIQVSAGQADLIRMVAGLGPEDRPIVEEFLTLLHRSPPNAAPAALALLRSAIDLQQRFPPSLADNEQPNKRLRQAV